MGKKIPELNAVSLFTGAGGLDLGLEAAGFQTIFATDIDEHSCITLNWGKMEAAERELPFFRHASIWQRDITHELEPQFILDASRINRGQATLLCGGPPCQAFSVFGKRRGREDPRGQLAYEYLRILTKIRPEVFVFENVYGILTVEGGEVFDEICDLLSHPERGLYYELSVLRLDAVEYGVPQFRDRIFIIGHRGANRIKGVRPITSEPDLFRELPNWRTVRDAFRGLPKMGARRIGNHTGRKHSERIKQRYASLLPGERDSVTRINKLDLDRPSFTIIVGSDKGGGKGHVHPIEPREVTPRESARIQTFPDWWTFSGTSRHPIRQVGNAVPPILGAVVGNAIRSQLLGLSEIPFESILTLLSQEHLFADSKVESYS